MYLIDNSKVIKSIASSQKTTKNKVSSSLLNNFLEGKAKADERECVSVNSFDEAVKMENKIVFLNNIYDITSDVVKYLIKTKCAPVVRSQTSHKITHIYIKEKNLTIYCDKNEMMNWEDVKQVCELVGIEFKNQSIGGLIQQLQTEFFKPERAFLTVPQRQTVLSRQSDRCGQCKKIVEQFEYDHIKPLCRGGGNELDNIQALCKECHKVKTADDLEDLVKYNAMSSAFNSETQK